MYGRPNSVVAKANNQNLYEEAAGPAEDELLPGTGAVVTEDENGERQVEAAGADELTYKVVREGRNPPFASVDDPDTAPIDVAVEAGMNVELVGFNRFDRARLRLSEHASASPDGNRAAFDEDGFITDADGTVDGTDPAEEFIGEIVRIEEHSEEDDLAVVEFY